jgi:hypothetical protein
LVRSARLRTPLGVVAIALAVLVAGAAVGWIVGDSGKTAEAASRVQFLPAAAIQSNSFTPAADIRGPVTIEGSGPFGGSGSNFVCDRERLIEFLAARPDRLEAWARVVAIEPTLEAVTRYIRSLKAATLVAPTRVTNHSYVNGSAVAFQAILGPGTAVLVDDDGAIRARCRCGNPLLDPVLSSAESCEGCPPSYRPSAWQMASVYYALHPSPPPVPGEEPPRTASTDGSTTVHVIRTIERGYVLEEEYVDDEGRKRTRTITVPKPPEPPKPKTRVVTKTRTRTVTVESPPQTVFVPEIQTVTVTQTVPQVQTITVYRDEG